MRDYETRPKTKARGIVLNGLALCAGVGGLERGLKLAIGEDYKCLGYCEREAYAARVLVARMEDKTLDDAPIWDDLKSFPSPLFRGKVDLISAGFPCQPWSVAGQRKGIEDERWLWPAIADIIREVEPRIVFLENVPGLLIGGAGPVFGELASMGFDSEWGIFSASEVGAPHKRERVFILSYAGRGTKGRIQYKTRPRGIEADAQDGGEKLGDAQGKRLGETGNFGSGSKKRPSGGSSEMAYAESRGLGIGGQSSGGRGLSNRGDEDLVDPEGARRPRHRSAGGIRQEVPKFASPNKTKLGDPSVQGLQESDEPDRGEGTTEGRGGPDDGPQRSSFPFPPGPGDSDGWTRYSGPKPALRRGSHGMASDVDISLLMDYIQANGSKNQVAIAEKSVEEDPSNSLRILWLYYQIATTSLRFASMGESEDSLPEMPHESGAQERALGEGTKEKEEMSDMPSLVYPWQTSPKDLLVSLPFNLGETERILALAFRVDRLRTCGNGVVPQQAAYAFRTLWDRLDV